MGSKSITSKQRVEKHFPWEQMDGLEDMKSIKNGSWTIEGEFEQNGG